MTQIRDFPRGLGGESEVQACVQEALVSIKLVFYSADQQVPFP